MTKIINFIAVIITFSFLFTACEKDTEDDTSTDDPVPTESSFDFINMEPFIEETRHIDFINENEGWAFGVNYEKSNVSTLLHTDNGGSSWTTMNTELPFGPEEIQFYNSTDGYLISDGDVSYTTDKGANWTDMVFSEDHTPFISAIASNSTTTIMLASDSLYFVSNDIHNVTNTVSLNEDFSYGCRMHLSENGAINIAAIKRDGNDFHEIAYSADNGASWTYTEIETETGLANLLRNTDMSFPDDNTGYFTGRDNGYDVAFIYKTTNGGSSWNKISITSSSVHYNFNQICFANATHGLATGMSSVFKTVDGGETWTEFTYFGDNYYGTYNISYPSQEHGFINGLKDADDVIWKYTGQ